MIFFLLGGGELSLVFGGTRNLLFFERGGGGFPPPPPLRSRERLNGFEWDKRHSICLVEIYILHPKIFQKFWKLGEQGQKTTKFWIFLELSLRPCLWIDFRGTNGIRLPINCTFIYLSVEYIFKIHRRIQERKNGVNFVYILDDFCLFVCVQEASHIRLASNFWHFGNLAEAYLGIPTNGGLKSQWTWVRHAPLFYIPGSAPANAKYIFWLKITWIVPNHCEKEPQST